MSKGKIDSSHSVESIESLLLDESGKQSGERHVKEGRESEAKLRRVHTKQRNRLFE